MNSYEFVFQTLKAFGVYEEGDLPSLTGGQSPEEAIKPVMDALADYRDNFRSNAKDPQALLQLSDQLRDATLPPLGIGLRDEAGKKATWIFGDPAELIKERNAAEEARRKAADAKREKAEKLLLQKSTPPKEWYKVFPDPKAKYTQFDDAGVPTHWMKAVPKGPDKGKEVEKETPKEERTKCMKALAAQ